ncbi:MAG: nucleolar RNA-binding Nop10p family protein [Candidatus Micrarchaeota archaeon]
MMFKMRFCKLCESYTLSELHCKLQTISAHPHKFNPTDPYGDYRRKVKFGA